MAKVNKVARLAVAKAIPLEKFATGMATSVTRATSPAMECDRSKNNGYNCGFNCDVKHDSRKFFHNEIGM